MLSSVNKHLLTVYHGIVLKCDVKRLMGVHQAIDQLAVIKPENKCPQQQGTVFLSHAHIQTAGRLCFTVIPGTGRVLVGLNEVMLQEHRPEVSTP